MTGVFSVRDGKLVEMTEQPYATESELQRFLAATPHLLSAEADAEDRRRWLLIRREMGVASEEEAGDRWSLDHLFVDEEAIPTLVEVKRSSDTRLRREVVGQMLDYAANASVVWDAGAIRAAFESRFDSPEDAMDALSDFLEGDSEPDDFWDTVEGRLRDRRLRLIFVADQIPAELRAVIEFLNEQMELTEVIAVEIKQYVDVSSGDRAVVPRVIGETEMARRVKRRDTKRRPRTSEAAFRAQIEDAYPAPLAVRVLRLYDWTKRRATREKFGRGRSASVTVWLGENEDPNLANPLAVTFWGDGGGISITMKYFHGRRSLEEMERLVALLRTLNGTDAVLDDAVAKNYRTFCVLPTEKVLASDDDLARFQQVLVEASTRGEMPEGS